jgi:amino acid transporter
MLTRFRVTCHSELFNRDELKKKKKLTWKKALLVLSFGAVEILTILVVTRVSLEAVVTAVLPAVYVLVLDVVLVVVNVLAQLARVA